METQAWIVIVADADVIGKALVRTLELMNAEVDLVQTETEIVTLMRRSKRAPNLLYILADEFGGLERQYVYIKIYIGKTYSGNPLFSQMTHQAMA